MDFRTASPGWQHADAGIPRCCAFFRACHSAPVTALAPVEFDQKITQRGIVQPRARIKMSAQDVSEFDLGWERKIGRTADIARSDGGNTGGFTVMAGVRAWF